MELVKAKYKTGIYIGELIDVQEEQNRALFKVLAVETHPKQGDLHNPKQVDVAYFHQRKALAYLEKAWVPLTTVKSYEGTEAADYESSLREAWQRAYDTVAQDDSEWARKSLHLLDDLRHDYSF
ncbi:MULTISPECIES: kinase-associated lipoprotein B [Shouchella]|uniref:Kinase-associated protein n=2 Tax=Bacillaceae TaxID=186817 RepID=A0A060M394_9BACI|nr:MULTISPECIES: kinase-associated lipoprotein B [Bacillaceae]AIC94539.1 kinase-associated protein [Shouchella lehensis G1]KQL51897.1 kinase [Alkalicoccobacillus plakortidis]